MCFHAPPFDSERCSGVRFWDHVEVSPCGTPQKNRMSPYTTDAPCGASKSEHDGANMEALGNRTSTLPGFRPYNEKRPRKAGVLGERPSGGRMCAESSRGHRP